MDTLCLFIYEDYGEYIYIDMSIYRKVMLC